MTAKQLMIEMALALLLATFAMSLDNAQATARQETNNQLADCQQRLPALSGATTLADNHGSADQSITDVQPGCNFANGRTTVSEKTNDWLKLLP